MLMAPNLPGSGGEHSKRIPAELDSQEGPFDFEADQRSEWPRNISFFTGSS